MMNKEKFYRYIIFALLAVNLLMFFFICTRGRMGGRPDAGSRDIIIEKLQLDKEQVKLYDGLIKTHRAEISNADMAIRISKNDLYSMLAEDENMQKTDSLTEHIAELESVIEKINYRHFLAIKKLCRPDQMVHYNALTKDLTKLFSHKPTPPRKHE